MGAIAFAGAFCVAGATRAPPGAAPTVRRREAAGDGRASGGAVPGRRYGTGQPGIAAQRLS
jgi:hypothetical protein